MFGLSAERSEAQQPRELPSAGARRKYPWGARTGGAKCDNYDIVCGVKFLTNY